MGARTGNASTPAPAETATANPAGVETATAPSAETASKPSGLTTDDLDLTGGDPADPDGPQGEPAVTEGAVDPLAVATAPDASKPAAKKATAKRTAKSEPVAESADYEVTVMILGDRDGKPWPEVGKSIKLPIDEGDQYARLGYVKPRE